MIQLGHRVALLFVFSYFVGDELDKHRFEVQSSLWIFCMELYINRFVVEIKNGK